MVITVDHSDGSSAKLDIKPSTIVAFERQYGVGLGAIADGKMEYVYWLAWHAEKLSGAVVKPFEGWLEDIEGVDLADDAVPTEAPAGAATPAT